MNCFSTSLSETRFGEPLEFHVGSLLETAAFQFFEDFSGGCGGFQLRVCENRSCARRLYYDNDPRSRFCSQRCASTDRQREHRAANRREFEAGMKRRSKGRSAREGG
jgi:hypothetical protein